MQGYIPDLDVSESDDDYSSDDENESPNANVVKKESKSSGGVFSIFKGS